LPVGTAISAKTALSWQLNHEDDAFLEELAHRDFRYFWDQADPHTGLILDRIRIDGSPDEPYHRNIASIASTGFGLTALAIGAERHWISQAKARERVRTTLRFFAERAPQEHGWFYHFLDATTGERRWTSEVSSMDTALLLGGVLEMRQAFRGDPEIVRLASLIYERVDFPWMLDRDPMLLCHGWTPETGFLRYHWDTYSEETILYLLAIGSPTHPIEPWSWYGWSRPSFTYAGYTFVAGGPLFIHQYSHAWVDFRGRREVQAPYIDYFANSVAATRAYQALFVNLGHELSGYSAVLWGITPSDSAEGYMIWGWPPSEAVPNSTAISVTWDTPPLLSPGTDLQVLMRNLGTIVPSAPGGSLMFAPDITLPALRVMRERFGKQIWNRYGFADSFNPSTGWVSSYVIGIDAGITLLSAENLRSGNVWRWFMGNPEPARAMDLVGLRYESPADSVAVTEPPGSTPGLTDRKSHSDPSTAERVRAYQASVSPKSEPHREHPRSQAAIATPPKH
jgi:hypothetical protein